MRKMLDSYPFAVGIGVGLLLLHLTPYALLGLYLVLAGLWGALAALLLPPAVAGESLRVWWEGGRWRAAPRPGAEGPVLEIRVGGRVRWIRPDASDR